MSTLIQVKAIYTLLGKLGLRDEKESIVSGFTGGRTKSTRKMSQAEAAALIGHLKNQDPSEPKSEKMRNKILSMAHEMKWLVPDTGKVDMSHVNNWCITYGHGKKRLDDYEYAELPKLVSQFEEVYKRHLKCV